MDEDIGAKIIKEIEDIFTPTEKRVLWSRCGLVDGRQRTMEEVGQEFGITRERIRQIESKAIGQLRRRIKRGP